MESTSQQNIFVYDRKKFRISGVTDISLFTENEITLETTSGTLLVLGRNMKMGGLDANKHEAEFKGEFDGCEYLKGKGLMKPQKSKASKRKKWR